MQVSFTTSKDTLTPDIFGKIKALGPAGRSWVLRGLGEILVNQTKRAFFEPSLRPIPWVAKVDGSPATLRKDQMLRRTIRVVSVSADSVLVGTDRVYGAIHQLGGQTGPHIIKAKPGKALFWAGAAHPVKQVKHPGSKIPARPYFPFYPNGQSTTKTRNLLASAAMKRLKSLGM